MSEISPLPLSLTEGPLADALATAPLYEKKAVVTMRVGAPGEVLETRLADGTLETTRVLTGGEAVVKNPAGEEYAMGMEKFQGRYRPLGDGTYQATGEALALKNPTGSPITITAPWGEEQYGDEECFLARSPENPSDAYIIGGQEFQDTYRLKD